MFSLFYICFMENSVSINIESIIRRKTEQILTSEVGDELVMMDIDSGQYITFNKVAHLIWQQLEQPVKVNDMILALMEKFAVSKEECTKDTLDCLNKMNRLNMLSVL